MTSSSRGGDMPRSSALRAAVPLVELARKLAEIMPGELSVSFFVNSGSEANETALKMARQYQRLRGFGGRHKTILYHGPAVVGSLDDGAELPVPTLRLVGLRSVFP